MSSLRLSKSSSWCAVAATLVMLGCESVVGIEDVTIVDDKQQQAPTTPPPGQTQTPPASVADSGAMEAAAPVEDASPGDASIDGPNQCAVGVPAPKVCAQPGFKSKNEVCVLDCACQKDLWCVMGRDGTNFNNRCCKLAPCGAPCETACDCSSLSCSLVTHKCE